MPKKTLTKEEFIRRSLIIHNDVYDYTLVKYEHSKQKVQIICKIHGVFLQTPKLHFNGFGCKLCSNKEKSLKHTKTTEQFISDAKKIHKNYEYNLSNYISDKKKIIIVCQKHGQFNQTPNNHLNGQGCPKCKESKGELKIRNFLDNKKIEYIYQATFEQCKNKNKLPFDFYLPTRNLLIEFDGIQHFKPTFGGKSGYEKVIFNDKIKNKFSENNMIKLVRIAYTDINNIEMILNTIL